MSFGLGSGPSLLVIPSLINRWYILDLMKECSFVRFMADRGFRVFALDWGIPGPEHDHLDLETYMVKWIGRAARKVRDEGDGRLFLMGYCMGATMAAVYAAVRPEGLDGFISLAAPYDFSCNDTLSTLARQIDVDRLVDAIGTMPPELMQAGFMYAQPTSALEKMKSLYRNNGNPARNRTFSNLEQWLCDNVPFPAQAYRQYIKGFYQENALVNETMTCAGERVSLANITMPVLNVVALKDNIVPAQAAKALNSMVSSPVNEHIDVDAGHIGVIMGSKAKDAWQGIGDWMEKVKSGKATS